jgi:ribulose-5-phosphate 4-epimerase/fuculose-1-phosphate aldolase
MTTPEGVIKFNLTYGVGPAPFGPEWIELNAWRTILYLNHLIGQDPERYGGYGYGNLSRRLPPYDAPPDARAFIISGTQTGHLSELGPEHYTTVTGCDPATNTVHAFGPVQPSSESLTHGAVYALDPEIRVVLHAHSPEIWQQAAALGLPFTDPDVAYGTPEMAAEVARLYEMSNLAELRIFVMSGHEDGIVAFGNSAAEAGQVLMATLAAAKTTTA